jgi:hypothetical protein
MTKIILYEDNHKIINGVLYKLCNICFEWFPCTDKYFYKNKSNKKDGLNPSCIICLINKANKRYSENKDEINKKRREKHKNNPEIKRKEALNPNYKITKSLYTKEWMRTNEGKQKLKGYGKTRQHKNHDITKQEWNSCKEYFNNQCAYCGLPIEDHYRIYAGKLQKSDFHKEHVDHFGKNDLSNCVPACLSCNSKKWEYSLEKWYNENDMVGGEIYNKERLDKILKWINGDYKKYEKSFYERVRQALGYKNNRRPKLS